MMYRNRSLIFAVEVIIGFVMIGSSCLGGSSDCSDSVKQIVQSSDGQFAAVEVARDCGATTDYATQVLLQTTADKNTREAVFIASGTPNIKLSWQEHSLTIDCSGCQATDIFEERALWRDIQIIYTKNP